MQPLDDAVDSIAERIGFSGVVRVDRSGDSEFAKAYGLADRAHEIANTIDTRFAIASGTKGFTALTVMSLVEEGALDLDTTARSVLGDDLPLIDDGVTVEHLLSFCSTHDAASMTTYTVISNSSEGAWPIIRLVDEQLAS